MSCSAKLTGNKRVCFLKDILSSSYHIFLNCEIFNYVSGSIMYCRCAMAGSLVQVKEAFFIFQTSLIKFLYLKMKSNFIEFSLFGPMPASKSNEE